MAHHKFYLRLKFIAKTPQKFIEVEDSSQCCEDFLCASELENEIGCDLQAEVESHITNFSNSVTLLRKSSSGSRGTSQRETFHTKVNCHFSGKRKRIFLNLITRSFSAPDPSKRSTYLNAYRNPFAKDLHVRNSCTMPKTSCKKQNLKLVRLLKNPGCGLGMVITCGNTYDTVLNGAFVETVTPGGPVDIEGNISSGDQIVSVNGVDVRNDHFLEVVDLIQNSSSPVEIIISKANKIISPYYLENEISEPINTKTKTWKTGNEKSNNLSFICSSSYEGNLPTNQMPKPKPRRKSLSKDNSPKKLHFDAPDLTLNHTMAFNLNDSWETEDNSPIRDNSNIPDIIASQTKSECQSRVVRDDSFSNDAEQPESDAGNILPGEVYHVVLDKRGGSLGLNIYQGTEPHCSEQRHIYVHSVIMGGAAQLDGRIRTGDKLLEVNGFVLENLSYDEVVAKLRESPQVTHLVLERGDIFSIKSASDNTGINTTNSQNLKDTNYPIILTPKPNIPKKPDIFKFPKMKSNPALNQSHKTSPGVVTTHSKSNSFDENQHSLSFKLDPPPAYSGSSSAKETISAPSSYQHSYTEQCKTPNNKTLTIEPPSAINGSNHSDVRFKHSLVSYKSTPNLMDNSDDEDPESNGENSLYRNRSTNCLLSNPLFNSHMELVDLCQNYTFVRGSSSNLNQIPAVPIRKKKLKKLEDIYSFCNAENTFTVKIRKSSRGLGISISGGRDSTRPDPFSQLVRIRKLYPLQPALECGKLLPGDAILEVNGTTMVGLSNTEALEVLRSVPTEVILKVFRPSKSVIPSISIYKDSIWPFFSSSSSSASSSFSQPGKNAYDVETGEFEITLTKIEGSLGFTILRHEESSDNSTPSGIYVKALIREPAISDGRIQPGDHILQVNETPMSSMTHFEAINFIRETPNTVTLKLYRVDPPLSPGTFEDSHHVSKPLRWEAVELVNDRKQKDNAEECNTLKRKLKRKLDRTSNAPSNSSTESEVSSSSGQEHVISEEMSETVVEAEELESPPGLQRNQRPKSLDVLNSSDRKRLSQLTSEESFHRQASVMCSATDPKSTRSDCVENGVESSAKKGMKTLLKWRGCNLPDSEDPDASFVRPMCHSLSEDSCESLQVSNAADSEDEDKPVPLPRTTSAVSNEWVQTFDVALDRGWHGRLGFSLFDPPSYAIESKRNLLPKAAEVKAVHPGSLASKDGRIQVGDRLVEANFESLLGKSANEVIDILRKTRGVIKLVLCRLQKKP